MLSYFLFEVTVFISILMLVNCENCKNEEKVVLDHDYLYLFFKVLCGSILTQSHNRHAQQCYNTENVSKCN